MKKLLLAAAAAGMFSVTAWAEPTETGEELEAGLADNGAPTELSEGARTAVDAIFGGEEPNPVGEGLFYNPIWTEIENNGGPNVGATADATAAGVIMTVFTMDVPPEGIPPDDFPPEDPVAFVTDLINDNAPPPVGSDPDNASAPLSITGSIVAREDACIADLPPSVDFVFDPITQDDLAGGTVFASGAVEVNVTCGTDRMGEVTLRLGTDETATSDVVSAQFTSTYDGPTAYSTPDEPPTTIDVTLAFDDQAATGTAAGTQITASTTEVPQDIFATIEPNADHRLGGDFDTENDQDLTLFAVIDYPPGP